MEWGSKYNHDINISMACSRLEKSMAGMDVRPLSRHHFHCLLPTISPRFMPCSLIDYKILNPVLVRRIGLGPPEDIIVISRHCTWRTSRRCCCHRCEYVESWLVMGFVICMLGLRVLLSSGIGSILFLLINGPTAAFPTWPS